jgi:hypothetical protein
MTLPRQAPQLFDEGQVARFGQAAAAAPAVTIELALRRPASVEAVARMATTVELTARAVSTDEIVIRRTA